MTDLIETPDEWPMNLVKAFQTDLTTALRERLSTNTVRLSREELEAWFREYLQTDPRGVMVEKQFPWMRDKDDTMYFYFNFLLHGRPSHLITTAVNQNDLPLAPDYLSITRSIVVESE